MTDQEKKEIEIFLSNDSSWIFKHYYLLDKKRQQEILEGTRETFAYQTYLLKLNLSYMFFSLPFKVMMIFCLVLVILDIILQIGGKL